MRNYSLFSLAVVVGVIGFAPLVAQAQDIPPGAAIKIPFAQVQKYLPKNGEIKKIYLEKKFDGPIIRKNLTDVQWSNSHLAEN